MRMARRSVGPRERLPPRPDHSGDQSGRRARTDPRRSLRGLRRVVLRRAIAVLDRAPRVARGQESWSRTSSATPDFHKFGVASQINFGTAKPADDASRVSSRLRLQPAVEQSAVLPPQVRRARHADGDSAAGRRPLRRADDFRTAPVIERAVGEQPAILIGSSLGGYLAALYAARHPAQIERLVLLAPAFQFPRRWRERYSDRIGSAGSAKAPLPFFTTARAGNAAGISVCRRRRPV